MISFKEISDFMNTGQVFTCKVITYDRKRKTGGEVKAYRAILMKGQSSSNRLRPSTLAEQVKTEKRNPQHKKWYTRNIRIVSVDDFETQMVRKIHIPLIVEFNSQTVTP